jgi:hypothetical protein
MRNVVEERQARPLEQDSRRDLLLVLMLTESLDHRVEQVGHLAIDDDRVEPFLAAEVLVDDGLGDVGLGGNLLDADGLEALLREQATAHVEQLLAPLLTTHAHALVILGAARVAPRCRDWRHVAGQRVRVVDLDLLGCHDCSC